MQKKDVLDAIVIDMNGYPVKSTMPEELTLRYVGYYGQVIDKARFMFKKWDSNDEITFMRVRSKNHEVIITPDDKCIFLVIQNPRSEYRLDGVWINLRNCKVFLTKINEFIDEMVFVSSLL